jgi:copper chaperone CopZ
MKNIFLICLAMIFGLGAKAQFSKASLQASGLTCSMCSKAVKIALEDVPSVEKVMVDIKSQQYNITFKPSATVNFDDLSKAVEDAGFSVASLKVSADVNNIKAEKDKHIQIGDKYFHFLNASGQQLNGTTTFTLVDKSFLPAKDFKKHTSTSKMMCVQTGKAAACCSKDNVAPESRVYHVII